MTLIPIMDRLRADGRVAEALSFVLGRAIDPKKTEAIRCLNPGAHKNGDKNPSCICEPDAGRVSCRACGLNLGILETAVYRNLAPTERDAAKLVEEHLYGTPHSNGHTNGTAPRPWPEYPKTAASLGWEVFDDGGVAAMRCPTFLPDGTAARVKIRREKDKGKPTASWDGDGPCGMLGLDRVLNATDSAESPQVALLAGETDLLAWTWHAQSEGISVHGVSMSTGETARLGEFAKCFRGMRVLVLYDADDTGRAEGPKRAAELEAAGAAASVAFVPRGKDVREYLGSGGSVRELLALGEPSPKTEKPVSGQLRTLSEILDLPIVEPEWFVYGLLGRKRITILTAAPKTGKSAASLGVAFKLASGLAGNWLGTDFGTSIGIRVLYLSAEGGIRLIQTRYKLLADGLGSGWQESFYLLTERPWPRLDTPTGLQWLRDTLTAHPCDLLVIDPLARFRDLEAENDNAATQAFCENLRSVVEDFNLACLLVHHPSKASGSDREGTTYYGGRGATALFGEVDAAISLRKDTKSGEIRAYFELRDSEPIEPGRRLSLNKENLWLDYEGDLGEQQPGGRPAAIDSSSVLAAIRANPTGLPWAQVYKHFPGGKKSTWFEHRGRVLTELAGKIRLDGPNCFPI